MADGTGNATYAAFSTDGISTRLVDQKTNSNTWTDLRIKLSGAANTLATLKLTPTTAGTVAADAVRALPLTVTTTVNYVFTDHLNTPRVITRASDNQMVWRWDSAEPFGNSQPNPNPAGLGTFTYNPRFPGQLYDVETGLYYNYHRSYSPSVGSYTQSDPIGLRGGINTYAYVGGNPVNFIDPLGLTQRDIDVARLLAIQSQPDLAFPDTYGSSDRIGKEAARTIYEVGTVLNSAYQKDLKDDQAKDLLNTIIHEGIHLKYPPGDPRNIEDDIKHTGYPYEEAARRLKNNPELVKEFLKRRKEKLVCP